MSINVCVWNLIISYFSDNYITINIIIIITINNYVIITIDMYNYQCIKCVL